MKANPEVIRNILEDMIPFNNYLGIKLESLDIEMGVLVSKIVLRPEFVGNVVKGYPHGGLISTLIDGTAGAATTTALDDLSLADRIATIDMRVDYLKASQGKILFAKSEVIRSGKRIIVVKTDVYDDDKIAVALGMNTFVVLR